LSKFYLENEYNDRIDLQNDDLYCIATDTSGWGVAKNSSYIAIGDHFVRNYLKTNQNEFSMVLNFVQPHAFDKLQKVSNFLLKAAKLYLIYVPDLKNAGEYRRDVDVTSFMKTDGVDGLLRYTLKLRAKSLFYDKHQTKFYVDRTDGEFRFDFTWPIRFNDYANREMILTNNGHVDAGFSFEIYGYSNVPKVSLFQNNKLIKEITLNCEVLEGEKVEYCSLDGNLYVNHVNASGVRTSLYNTFDLSDDIFFKIPAGDVQVKFTAASGTMNQIYFTLFKFYEVV
jgi:hypothetical protein